jgi:UDP-glucuronate decarboxylase
MAKNLKIMITGGAGFIGSHLCEYLLNQGHKVICLDNFFTSKRENVEHLLLNKNFKLIEHSINKPLPIKKIGEIDRIYNLACPASPLHYQFDPVETVKTNVLGVVNVLELARQTGARILQASTSEVYGDPKEHPQKETYNGSVSPISIRACYDEGKRCAETLFMDYHRQYGIEIKIVRIFNTYGPKMAAGDGRVVSNFILQALNGEDITMYGDGNQTRSFQYVSDLVEATVKMMETTKDIIGPINIGNPVEITLLELCKKIVSLTGSRSRIVFLPLPANDPIHRQPDIALAKKILNWQPKVLLNEGLQKTIDYFKGQLKYRDRRILVFNLSYLPLIGGVELTLAEIIKSLPGVEFDIVTARLNENLSRFEKFENVSIHRIGGGSRIDKILFPIRAFFKGWKLFKERKYSTIWAKSSTYAGIAALLMKLKFPKVNYLLTLRESTPEKRIKQLARFVPFYKLVYRKADFIQAVGSSFEKRVRDFGYTGVVSIIPGAIDMKQFRGEFSEEEQIQLRKNLGIGPSEKIVVSISHFVEQDGLEDLINAASLIKSTNLKFLIIGEGKERGFIQEMIRNLGLEDRFVFSGYINNLRTIKILRIADFLVRPATSGGSGITVLEAMAARTFVISTLAGGAKDFLIDGKNGFVIEPGRPEIIAEKINTVLENENLKEQLLDAAEELIINKYYWEKINSKIRNILERMLFIG